MEETPMTWLLNTLRVIGRQDLVDEYHARHQAYQKMLTKRSRERMKMHIEELKARKEKANEE